jgi:hypothetical protein
VRQALPNAGNKKGCGVQTPVVTSIRFALFFVQIAFMFAMGAIIAFMARKGRRCPINCAGLRPWREIPE